MFEQSLPEGFDFSGWVQQFAFDAYAVPPTVNCSLCFHVIMLWQSGARRQKGTGGVGTGVGANCANRGD